MFECDLRTTAAAAGGNRDVKTSISEIEIVPAGGTNAANCYTENFGTFPFCKQLSDKQSSLSALLHMAFATYAPAFTPEKFCGPAHGRILAHRDMLRCGR